MRSINSIKKLLAAVLVAALICTCVPIQGVGATKTFAEENLRDFVINDDGELIEYTGSGGDVVIPYGVTCIDYSAFENCSGLTSVIIPRGATSIAGGAFKGCSGLKSVTIPEGMEMIGWYAFENCSGLTSITIPKSVMYIFDAFRGCSGLTSITVAKGNRKYDSREDCNAIIETEYNKLIAGCKNTVIPEGVTSIGYSAFDGCSGLTSITIPEGVTNIDESAFEGCSGLENITVAEGNSKYDSRDNCNAIIETESNTLIAGCKKTVIPKSVKGIEDDAFNGCNGLTSIIIPKGVTSIGNSTFWDCSSLTSVTIPIGVTDIGSYAFGNCSSLTSVTIPEGVTNIPAGTFYGCSDLTSITIPKSVKNIAYATIDACEIELEGAFDGCDKLTTIKGKKGSYAESYAKENGYKFETIEDGDVSNKLESVIYSYGNKSIDLLTTAHSIESTHKPFNIICTSTDNASVTKYELYSGDKKIYESTDGKFENINASKFTSGKDVSIKVYVNGKAVTTQLFLEVKDKKPLLKSTLELGGSGVSFTLDNDVPLVGGSNIKLNFPEIPISAIIEDGKIKVGINIKEEELYSSNSYSGVTTTTKKKSMKQKISDWKKDLIKADYIGRDANIKKYLEKANLKADVPFVSTKADFTVFGYLEGEWSDSLESISGEIVVAIKKTSTFQHQFVSQIPITVNCSVTAEGEADGTIKLDVVNDKVSGELALDLSMAIEPYAGIGAGTWLSIGVYGQAKGGVDFTLLSSEEKNDDEKDLDIYMSGETGIKGYFAKKELFRHALFSMEDLKKTDMGKYINDENQLMIYSRNKNSLCNKKSKWKTAELLDNTYVWNKAETSVYLSPAIDGSNTHTATLVENAYGAAEPQIITVGNTTLVAYLDNDESRALPNQTVVKYAAYNSESGKFSDSKIALDDSTADYKPQLFTDGVDIYLYYLDSTRVYSGNDDPDIEDYAGTFSVTVAKYDTVADSFIKLGTISRDNHYCYAPTLANTENGLLLAWAENESNSVFGLTEDNSINYSIFSNGNWSEPKSISTALKSITSLAAGEFNGTETIAYSMDLDNDFTTTDQKVYLVDDSEKVTESIEGSVSNIQFAKLPNLSQSVLAFNLNGAVAYIDDTTAKTVELFDENTMDSASEFTIQDNKIYYLKTSNDNSRDICCAIYADGQWRNIILADESDYVDAFSVSNGMLIYLLTDASLEENNEIMTSSTIKLLSSTEISNLTINSVDFDSLNINAGSDLELEMYITNNGTKAVNNPMVSFYLDGDANSYQSTQLSCSINPGETVKKNVTVTAPKYFYNAVYSVKIEESGVNDIKEEDNIAEVDLSKTELEINTEYKIIEGEKLLAVYVSNISNVPSVADVLITDSDGNIVYTQKNVYVPANDSKNIFMVIEDDLLKGKKELVLTVAVSAKEEEYYLCNNMCEQRIWEIKTWEPVVADILPGDANLDNKVDLSDAKIVLKAAVGIINITGNEYKAADVNKDGTVNLKDAKVVLKLAVGIPVDIYAASV